MNQVDLDEIRQRWTGAPIYEKSWSGTEEVDRRHTLQLCDEIERLSGVLHRLQKHPDYDYAFTFEGNTAHYDMSEWEPNDELQDISDASYAERGETVAVRREGRRIWWRKRRS